MAKKRWTITLKGYIARGMHAGEPNNNMLTVIGDLLKYSDGHLVFIDEDRIIRVCAPGNWAFVVEEPDEYAVAS